MHLLVQIERIEKKSDLLLKNLTTFYLKLFLVVKILYSKLNMLTSLLYILKQLKNNRFFWMLKKKS